MSENPVEQEEVQAAPVVEATPEVIEVSPEPVPVAPKPTTKPAPKRAKATKPAEKKVETSDQPDLVAVYSDHPVFWPGVGSVGKGYTLMPPAVAKKWTDRGLAKEASPDEVAKAYGA